MPYPLATRKTAAEDDVPEPPRSLTQFIGDVRSAAEFASGIRAALSTLSASLDTETIFQTTQAVFEIDVARRGDIKNHIVLHRLRQADQALELRGRALDLTREKYEFNAASAVLERLAEIKEIDANRSLPQAEKIQAVRKHLFGAPPVLDDALSFADSSDETFD